MAFQEAVSRSDFLGMIFSKKSATFWDHARASNAVSFADNDGADKEQSVARGRSNDRRALL
jgi:hypothetical protein